MLARALLSSVLLCAAAAAPIVGILSLPVGECDSVGRQAQLSAYRASHPEDLAAATSCFDNYYALWLGAAGIQSAVLPFDASPQQMTTLLGSVNGVLFTGGSLYLTPNNQSAYYKAASFVFEAVKKINDGGDFLPLWGTCQGFQMLCMLAAGTDVLQRFAYDSDGISLALDLTTAANTSRMFGTMPARILSILTTENVTSNLHHDGVSPADFQASVPLSSFMNLLSVNVDLKGKAFVSSMEAFKYPIYGVQWHPERPQYDWTASENVSHTASAVEAMQYMANFFAAAVRTNTHSFANQSLLAEVSLFSYETVSPSKDSYQYYYFEPLTL